MISVPERLQRRIAYGGKKGRRAALRLRRRWGCGNLDRTQYGCALCFSGVDWERGRRNWQWRARTAGRLMPRDELEKYDARLGRELVKKHTLRESAPDEWATLYTNRDGSLKPHYWLDVVPVILEGGGLHERRA